MFETKYILLAMIAFIVLTGMMLIAKSGEKRPRFERKALMTKRELEFFSVLSRALPDHVISCQVSLGALLKPARGMRRQEFWRARNMISQKIVDFVVIQPNTGKVVAIIELDDASHNSEKDGKRDALLADGHYRVVRFNGRTPTLSAVLDHLQFLFVPEPGDGPAGTQAAAGLPT